MLLYDSLGIPRLTTYFSSSPLGLLLFSPNCGLEIALKITYIVKLMSLLIVPKVRWAKYVLLLFSKIKKNSCRGKVFAGTFLASGSYIP